jgi:serine/threonine protein kinase
MELMRTPLVWQAGTWGYIAPELARLGKATKATDIFAFGVFIMEVVCGRRPIGTAMDGGEPLTLADWVLSTWQSGSLIGAVDPKLDDYNPEDALLALKLGLLCSHPLPNRRPCMRQVILYMERDARLPEFSPAFMSTNADEADEEINQVQVLYPSAPTTITIISQGR